MAKKETVKKKVTAKKSTVKKTAKKAVKKAVQKVLDSTDLDEKLVAVITENKSVYTSVLCYINCYGPYVLAVGAGCTFGVNNWVALGLLAITAGWAYWNICSCKPCKSNQCSCK